jgi:hypothetical protein
MVITRSGGHFPDPMMTAMVVLDVPRELEPVQAAGHVDVREHDPVAGF